MDVHKVALIVYYLYVQKQAVQGGPSVHLYPSDLVVPLNLVRLPRMKRIIFCFFYINWENNRNDFNLKAPVLPFGPLGPSNPGRPACPGGPSHMRNIIKCLSLCRNKNNTLHWFGLTRKPRKSTITCKRYNLSCSSHFFFNHIQISSQ